MSAHMAVENSAYSLWSHSARTVFWVVLLACAAVMLFALVAFFTHEAQLHSVAGAAGVLGLTLL